MLLFVCTREAVVSKLVKLETSCRYSETSPNGECPIRSTAVQFNLCPTKYFFTKCLAGSHTSADFRLSGSRQSVRLHWPDGVENPVQKNCSCHRALPQLTKDESQGCSTTLLKSRKIRRMQLCTNR